MSEVLLLAVRFDEHAPDAPGPRVVTISHPCGRRFVVAEITERPADRADQDELDAGRSIW